MSTPKTPLKWPDRIQIVRHGQSSGNVARDLAETQGLAAIDIAERDMDVPLSQVGESQAVALGQWLAQLPPDERPTRALVSPYVRSHQTARIALTEFELKHAPIPIIIDERLREREFGIIDRLTKKGIEERFPDQAEFYARLNKFYYRPPGGESWCDVILRLRSVLDTLSRDHVGERVLIVCHTVVVHCLRYLFDGLTEAEILAIDRATELANCSVSTYVLDPNFDHGGKLVLDSYNFVGHLKEAGKKITRKPDVPVAPK